MVINKYITISDAIKFDTQLVIANAVYFKGLWETKFKPEATKPLLFHLSDGKTKTVPFMRMRHSFRYGIDEETESLVVVLPFEVSVQFLITFYEVSSRPHFVSALV